MQGVTFTEFSSYFRKLDGLKTGTFLWPSKTNWSLKSLAYQSKVWHIFEGKKDFALLTSIFGQVAQISNVNEDIFSVHI